MLRLFLVFTLFLGATFAENQTLEEDPCKTWRKVSNVPLRGNLRITKLDTGNYFFRLAGRTWHEAKDFCDSHGMKLAVFETKGELTKVKEAFPDTGAYWFGASDIGREPGHFYWSDGRMLDSNWHKNGRNYGAGKETCIFLHPWEGKLEDAPCTDQLFSVCEVRPEYQKCV